MNFPPRVHTDPYIAEARNRARMTKRAKAMTAAQLDASIRDYTNAFRARGFSDEFIEGLWYTKLLRSLRALKETA
jgi:microsomal dipeptidase-like Zn-dependent dipeptidase